MIVVPKYSFIPKAREEWICGINGVGSWPAVKLRQKWNSKTDTQVLRKQPECKIDCSVTNLGSAYGF